MEVAATKRVDSWGLTIGVAVEEVLNRDPYLQLMRRFDRMQAKLDEARKKLEGGLIRRVKDILIRATESVSSSTKATQRVKGRGR